MSFGGGDMNGTRKTIIAFILGLLVMGSAFAAPGYYESRLYYLPKSVESNKNVAIDLTSDKKSLSTTDYENSGINLVPYPSAQN